MWCSASVGNARPRIAQAGKRHKLPRSGPCVDGDRGYHGHMSDSLKIREDTSADVESIVLFNQLLARETEGRDLDAGPLRSGVEKAVARPELCRYFIAEQSGRSVGQAMVTYEWSDWRDGVFWWLQSVYVDADRRREGVFRRLYRHIATLAKGRPDVCGLRLYVHRANDRAKATYAEFGMSNSEYVVYEADWTDSPQS